MKLHQLFEFKDKEVPVEIRRDFRRLMLELTRWFPVKRFEPTPYAGETAPSPYYLKGIDEADNEVSIDLDTDSLQRWSVEISYNGDVKFFSKAKARQLERYLRKEFADVGSIYTSDGAGSFTVDLPARPSA